MLFEQKCQAGEEISKHNYISLLELVLSMGGVEMAEQIRRLVCNDILEYTEIESSYAVLYTIVYVCMLCKCVCRI